MSYLEEQVSEATVTLDLDIGQTGRAGREMTGQRTGVFRGVLMSVTNVVLSSLFCVLCLSAHSKSNAANVEKFNYAAECRILFQL